MNIRTCCLGRIRAASWGLVFLCTARLAVADVPFEGFLPLVGVGLTDEFMEDEESATFFIAQASNSPGGSPLGPGNDAYYDIALLDTGAATHILTYDASLDFNILGEGFASNKSNYQVIGGATGLIELRINDPLGVYVGGLADRSTGPNFAMTPQLMRGQTSFATLSAPPEWALPNIIGLPMAAQHAIHIQNSNPQIFEHLGRTVRTPQIDLNNLGSGDQGILRRSPLKLKPAIGFVQGPIYIQNLDISDPFNINFTENPLSPSVIDSGGLFIEVDLENAGHSLQDTELLLDTGASLTVVSEQTAVRLGFDPILDTPDFELSVEGSAGVSTGIPGFYLDELSLDTIGGSFSLTNVPIAVLDVTDPSDPGNVIDGILGMNVFAGRDLVIDANPSIGQGGAAPSLYISDPVTQAHAWGTTAVTEAWGTAANWSSAGVPAPLWDADVTNIRGSHQEAVASVDSTVFRATVQGTAGAEMSVRVASGATLTLFADAQVNEGGRIHLEGGGLDAQFVQLDGGTLSGSGHIFVGSGPLDGAVRSLGQGTVAPGDPNGDPIGTLEIVGDLSTAGTLSIDLGGTVAGTNHDLLTVDRFAFLSGTLEVFLVDAGEGLFDPQIGATFTILTAGDRVSGTFESLALPSGFTWDVNYTPTSVQLEVTGLGLLGDFNGDGQLGCDDINQLTTAVATGVTGSFDVTGDSLVDLDDIEEWVTNLKGTILGDANLDGQVDVSDYNLWNTNKLTDATEWCSGDFNGDGSVDVSDYNIWNTHKFSSATSVVPEPASLVLLWCAILGGWWVRGRCRHVGGSRAATNGRHANP